MWHWTVYCIKNHQTKITIVGDKLELKREFEDERQNVCQSHSKLLRSVYLAKSCMDCGHLVAERI